MVALEYTGYASLTFEGALSAAAKPGCFVAGTLVQVATKGKVQCIYIDPPYGIKFGSNWQVSTRKRDVKDGNAADAR